MPTVMTIMLVVVLALSVVYGLVNGMRDAPNAVALPVRQRALTPGAALLLAAVMNLVGGVLSGGFMTAAWQGLPEELHGGGQGLLLAGVGFLVAVGWGLFAWSRGMPVSMTHSIISAVLGGSLALAITGDLGLYAGWSAGLLVAMMLGLVLSVLLAWFLSWLLVTPATWLARDAAPGTVNHGSRMALAVSAAANALGHGVQSGTRMTFVLLLAFAGTGAPSAVGWWVPLSVGTVLAAGTLFGGWRIAHTLTERIVDLDPLRAGIASLVSAALLFMGAYALHLPLSSTHATVASIVGAGQNQPYTSVRWPAVSRIAAYWVATLLVCAGAALLITAAGSPLL
ncbi:MULTISPECIES: inorganic phosphate transporter [Citricoccus]|uniref:inorganic phosphate transporter n=1 Tax=Citricoccus TaxID=169133 RepID=UPI000255EDCE|nr:inorganic phosphate transporter [Citricoccus sp. CH26A]